MSTAYLILENGSVFQGETFGYEAETTGELVFHTGMTGYLEVLTDPRSFGQIALQTFPLIGNYGVIPSDLESERVHVKAYIVREWCQEPSNFRCEGNLDTFLRAKQIPGLHGIDTRAVTHLLREHGAMNARISKSPELSGDELRALREYRIRDAVSAVTCAAPYDLAAESARLHVGVLDVGAARSLLGALAENGCRVTVFPADTPAETLSAARLDGLVVSGGPGNPAEAGAVIPALAALRETALPTLGIGLGHQLLALARGGGTVRLHQGHRGANHPVRDTATGRLFATQQNHGYVVSGDALPARAKISYVNCNDGTCEGLEYTAEPVLSVQFSPPADSDVFQRFTDLMERSKQNAAE